MPEDDDPETSPERGERVTTESLTDHKYMMRYNEIIGGASDHSGKRAQDIWKQTQKSHEALRRLRSKQEDIQDSKAAAQSLPTGPERSRRLQAADRKASEARRVHGSTQRAAHNKITQTLSKE